MKKIIFLLILLLSLPSMIALTISNIKLSEEGIVVISLTTVLIIGLLMLFLYILLDKELKKFGKDNPNYNSYPSDNEFYDYNGL